MSINRFQRTALRAVAEPERYGEKEDIESNGSVVQNLRRDEAE